LLDLTFEVSGIEAAELFSDQAVVTTIILHR
jgi:hypothetical protein